MRGAEEGTRGFVLSGIQGWRNPLDFWDSRAPSFHFSPPKVKEIFKILKIEQTLSFPFILEERGTQDSPCLYPSVSCLLAGVWACQDSCPGRQALAGQTAVYFLAEPAVFS